MTSAFDLFPYALVFFLFIERFFMAAVLQFKADQLRPYNILGDKR